VPYIGGPKVDTAASSWIHALTKSDLHRLIDAVKSGDAAATARAAEFVAAESLGMWHNRARAKLCRYFKNHPPPEAECQKMIEAIAHRFLEGRFSEQFSDQLALAIRLDAPRMAAAASLASRSEKSYIRKYAQRVRHLLHSSAHPNREVDF